MDRHKQQVKMVYKPVSSVLRAKTFRLGYEEAKRGLPLDPDRYGANSNERWQYERGRQFAFIFDGTLKIGRQINYQAFYAFGNAVARGLII